MKNDDIYRVMRHELDEKLKRWVRLPEDSPEEGWVRALRRAMRMTTRQFARRMNAHHKSVSDIERNEKKGSLQLRTLQRAAEALNCRLVYAIVPKVSVEATFRERARYAARRRVEQHIKPDSDNDIEFLVDALAVKMTAKDAWEAVEEEGLFIDANTNEPMK